jgi:hypothetical protein
VWRPLPAWREDLRACVIGLEVEQPVFGKVSHWGRVVECEHGWRSQQAHPATLYVPTLTTLRARQHSERPPLPAETIANALTSYGIAVELIAGETLRDAAEQLAGVSAND